MGPVEHILASVPPEKRADIEKALGDVMVGSWLSEWLKTVDVAALFGPLLKPIVLSVVGMIEAQLPDLAKTNALLAAILAQACAAARAWATSKSPA